MKISLDFVTNSSSCSFICDICGNDATGWDMGLYDAEMVQCENGHTICESEIDMYDVIKRLVDLNGEKKTLKILNELLSENYEAVTSTSDDNVADNLHALILEERYDINEGLCPICLGLHIDNSITLDFLLKKYNENIDKINDDLRMIGNLGTIKKFLKE